MSWLQSVLQGLSSGSLTNDVLLVGGGVLAIALVVFFSRSLSEGARLPEDAQRTVATLSHKLSKIETELVSGKAEQSRIIELLRSEVEFLREELKELRVQVGILPKSGPLASPAATVRTETSSEVVDTFISPAEAVRRSRSFDSGAHPMPDRAVPGRVNPLENVDDADWRNTPAYDSGQHRARPQSLSDRLVRSRKGLFSRLKSLFGVSSTFDPRQLETLEETLIGADLGVSAVGRFMDELRIELSHGRVFGEEDLVRKIKTKLLTIMDEPITELRAVRLPNSALVVLVVGVNGVGKTTTCAKLAAKWKAEGKSVLLVAADTFRAAAVEQLQSWARRIGVDIVSGPAEAKPQTVVYEAMEKAKKGNYDIILVDTAGRLHNKSNLMQELQGVRNTLAKHITGAPHEVILVVDGTTGQNALNQAKEFHAAAPITGLIVTKLDGSSKGGIVVAIKEELSVPVRFIGVGEGVDDLKPFVAQEFVDALFDDRGLDLSESADSRPLA